jgi:hypothetical protein
MQVWISQSTIQLERADHFPGRRAEIVFFPHEGGAHCPQVFALAIGFHTAISLPLCRAFCPTASLIQGRSEYLADVLASQKALIRGSFPGSDSGRDVAPEKESRRRKEIFRPTT